MTGGMSCRISARLSPRDQPPVRISPPAPTPSNPNWECTPRQRRRTRRRSRGEGSDSRDHKKALDDQESAYLRIPTIQSGYSTIRKQGAAGHAPRAVLNDLLEVKTEFGRVTPWRYEVCAAKGGQEVVECNL